jgi:hypothetical protein
MDEEVLAGGIANAGAVTRIGEYVLRPSNPHSESIHRFLSSLRAAGFEGASMPVGVDDDGRERLVFIDGDVPVPPYAGWAQDDRALGSVTTLMRRFHDASRWFDPVGLSRVKVFETGQSLGPDLKETGDGEATAEVR